MKTILRAILNWLDRKFPDKVTVTKADYDSIEKRLRYLEAEVTRFNASLGFMGVKNNQGQPQMGPFQR